MRQRERGRLSSQRLYGVEIGEGAARAEEWVEVGVSVQRCSDGIVSRQDTPWNPARACDIEMSRILSIDPSQRKEIACDADEAGPHRLEADLAENGEPVPKVSL